MSKIESFSSKEGATRAALAALGPEAIPGTDYNISPYGKASFVWHVAGSEAPVAPEPKAKTPKKAATRLAKAAKEAVAAGGPTPPVKAAKAKRAPKAAAPKAETAPKAPRGPYVRRPDKGDKPEPSPRTSKQDLVTDLCLRPQGATQADIAAVTGWQAHSIRGFIAGNLKKRGYIVEGEKVDGVLTYRATAPATKPAPKAEGAAATA